MAKDWIWLSHITSPDTPAYGGGSAFKSKPHKEMCAGDSCNTVELNLSNHIGSHVDAPRHFVTDGLCVTDYSPSEWIFTKPLVVSLNTNDLEVITASLLESVISNNVVDADLVLIQTGIEKFRGDISFWKSPPAFEPELCDFLKNRFKSFTAIGMDTISISSFAHRDLGRDAHRAFLGAGIRIFEDLSLLNINPDALLTQVIALPFRYENADGAPTTLIGEVKL